ncbi:hypothetical protein BOTBODRAFT_162584 [Botryobasidium botryosum FD-172 SS1]|uniref:Nephrocystin 3-like N-terminal domain-containing protein n=1 Tax=Botryobasidium botryosum (strain FD-172 SS1) TaxID=930990 RepID=A0A067MIN7_BOTB1|nr:hypothetical protein BOTBODRAFT_162584 [Botryobasidium botryosum FD-172 SS1]
MSTPPLAGPSIPGSNGLPVDVIIESIELDYEDNPTQPISVKVFLDDREYEELPAIGGGQPRIWTTKIACGIRASSRITIKVHKIRKVFKCRDRAMEMNVTGQDALQHCANSALPLERDMPDGAGRLRVKFKLPESPRDLSAELRVAVDQVPAKTVLGYLGEARGIVEGILKLASAASKVNGTAEAVVAGINVIYEYLAQQDQVHRNTSDLIDRMLKMLRQVKVVKERARLESLKDAISEILQLTEQVLVFVSRYKDQKLPSRLWSLGDAKDKVIGLTRRFEDAERAFDRSVQVQAIVIMFTAEEERLLKKLKPVAYPRAAYNPERVCLSGTRTRLLDDIQRWAMDEASPSSLLWITGHPGAGKSSIASSIADELDAAGALGASFFCKRDDKDLHDPQRIIPTLVHQLTEVHKAYGKAVAEVLRETPRSGSVINDRDFENIVQRPLPNIQGPSHTSSLVIIVDALDECDGEEDCLRLVSRLVAMSKLVKWLKIIVTSRNLLYIRTRLDKDAPVRENRNLNDETPFDDILRVIKHLLEGVGPDDDPTWPGDSTVRQLARRADGLFIWAKVACALLKQAAESSVREKRLKELLASSMADDPARRLPALYERAIRESFATGESLATSETSSPSKHPLTGDDNDQVIRTVLGAIVVARIPLSESALAALLRSRDGDIKVPEVVQKLQSVLYVNRAKGGTIRVCHTSFRDFLVDSKYCPSNFYVDQVLHNKWLVHACLRTMSQELRFNICNLESSHLLNAEVHNLTTRVENMISSELEYSCLFWADHLSTIPKGTGSEVMPLLHNFFFQPSVLYWMEVLSLLGKLSVGSSELLHVMSWVQDAQDNISKMAADAYRFLHVFYQPISQSTPHLYVSALPFAPKNSMLKQCFLQSFTNVIEVTHGYIPNWTSLLHLLKGHTRGVTSVAYSPDGHYVVSGSADCTICIWDADSGLAVGQPLQGHAQQVRSVAYSPSGHHIVSGSADCTIRIWDAKGGLAVGEPLQGHTGRVNSVAYSPSGHHIVSGSDDYTICIWDAKSGLVVGQPLQGHTSWIRSVVYSPSGHHIVSSSEDCTVRIWDADSGLAVGQPQGHTLWVTSVAYSPSGHHIVSASADCTICIWDAENWVQSVAYSPDGHHIVSGSADCTIRIWDAQSVVYSPDGHYIVSGSVDHTICIWDAESGLAVSQPLKEHESTKVMCVAYSPDGHYIASAALDDHTIHIWDAESGLAVGEPLQGHNTGGISVAYSPDGHYIVSGAEGGTICIWDANSGLAMDQPLQRHTDWVISVAYSPDGHYIVSGSHDHTICIWDAKSGLPVGEPLQGHTDWVQSVAYSPDGHHIVSGSADYTIRIWDAQSGLTVGKPLQGHTGRVNSVAYSPDGHYIVSGSIDCTICIWDAESGLAVGEPLQGHTDKVISVAYSPDGHQIASASDDCTICIWDAESGLAIGESLQGHMGYATSVAYSPDGHCIVSGSWDGTIRIWSTENGLVVAEPLQENTISLGHIQHAAQTAASDSENHTLRDLYNPKVTSTLPKGPAQRVNDFLPLFNPVQVEEGMKNGWVQAPNQGLLLWIPHDLRFATFRQHHAQLLSIPQDAQNHGVTYNSSKFVHGVQWVEVKTS